MIPKKRLDIKSLSEHEFITKKVEEFTKIDKKEVNSFLIDSQLTFDMKKSTIPYFQTKKKPVDIEKSPTDSGTTDKYIEKLIIDSIYLINNDEISFEPKIIPFIPGSEPDILFIKE